MSARPLALPRSVLLAATAITIAAAAPAQAASTANNMTEIVVTTLEGKAPSLAVNQHSPRIAAFNSRGVSQNELTR